MSNAVLREVDFINKLSYGPEITKHFLSKKMSQRVETLNWIMQRNNLTDHVVQFCNMAIRSLKILENLIHENFNPLLENLGTEHFIQLMIKQYESVVHSLFLALRGFDPFASDYETPDSLLQKLQTESPETIKQQALTLINLYKDDICLIESCDNNSSFKVNLPGQPVVARLTNIALEQLESLRCEIDNINTTAPSISTANEIVHPESNSLLNSLKIALIRFNFIIHMITCGTSDYEKLSFY